MLAGVLILSMISGAVAAAVALGLGFPVWSLLFVYSLFGSATLLAGGALAAIVAPWKRGEPGYGAAQAASGRMPG